MKKIVGLFFAFALMVGIAITPTKVTAATNTEVSESSSAPIEGASIEFNQALFDLDYASVELFDIIYISDYVSVDGGALAEGEVTYEAIKSDVNADPTAGIIDVYPDGMLEVIRPGHVTIKISRITSEGKQDEHDYILVSFVVDGEAINKISSDRQRVKLVSGETAVVTLSVEPSILSDDFLYESISYLEEYDYDVFECERIYYDKVTGEAIHLSSKDLEIKRQLSNYIWKGELLITGIEVGEGNVVISDYTNTFETMIRVEVVEELVKEEEKTPIKEEKPTSPTTSPKVEEKVKPSISPITGLTNNAVFFVLVALAGLSGVALVKLNKKKL